MTKQENVTGWHRLLRRIKGLLLNNLGLKITSVILAFATWMVLSGGPRSEYLMTVPLNLEKYVPAGWALVQAPSTEVELKLQGNERIINLLRTSEEVRSQITINLRRSSFVEDTISQQVRVTNDNVILPYGLRVLSISPNEIRFQLDEAVTETKPVSLNITGSVADGYLVANDLVPNPENVSVTGAKVLVEQVDHLEANMDLSDIVITSASQKSVFVPIRRLPLLRYNFADVEVAMDIREEQDVITLDVNRFEFTGFDSASEEVHYAPSQLRWQISGPRSWIRKLNKDTVWLEMDITELQRNVRVPFAITNELLRFTTPPPPNADGVELLLISSTGSIDINIIKITR